MRFDYWVSARRVWWTGLSIVLLAAVGTWFMVPDAARALRQEPRPLPHYAACDCRIEREGAVLQSDFACRSNSSCMAMSQCWRLASQCSGWKRWCPTLRRDCPTGSGSR